MILDVVKAAQGTGTALTQFSFDLASLSPEAARNFTQAAIAAGLATLTFELGNFAPDKVELFMKDMEQVLLAAKQEGKAFTPAFTLAGVPETNLGQVLSTLSARVTEFSVVFTGMTQSEMNTVLAKGKQNGITNFKDRKSV